MDRRGLKRKVVMVQLRVLGMLGMHEKKAQVLRNSGLFKKYGGEGYWHTLNMPNRPWRISIGNNVNIATNVSFLNMILSTVCGMEIQNIKGQKFYLMVDISQWKIM